MQSKLYELTNPQKSIWYTEQFFKGTPIENITGSVILSKEVDFSVLENAINFFVEKNENFRLKFKIDNNEARQFVEPYKKFSIDTINVNSKNDLNKVEKEIAETPFNVINSFLFQFKLIKFPDNHGGFIINMHHLISDAWTAGLGATEIIKIYNKLLKNEDILDITYPSYIDYINSEKEYLNSEKYIKDKAFWNDEFTNVPEIASIPSGIPQIETNISYNAARTQFELSSDILVKINNYCKETKISMFNFFMAILSTYIYKVSNLNEFVIGTPILNRSNVKEKHTSGMFIDVVPLKVNIDSAVKFSELAANISSTFFNIFRHQKYPYLSILEDLRHKDSSLPNLYNIALSYQNIRSSASTSEIPYTITWSPANIISDDIDIHIYDMNDTGNINIAYDYRTSKYTEEDIHNIHTRLSNIITQVLNDSNIVLSDIEAVTSEEKECILFDFNKSQMDYPRNETVIRLFEKQVRECPDNIAVVSSQGALSYSELNKKVNSLANYLLEQGVKHGDIIPVVMDKSIDLIISMFAIIKTGAIYLPVSTEYPQERVNYIFKDCDAKCILTNSTVQLNFDNKINTVFINDFDYSKYGTQNLNIVCSPFDTLYIIYTSGSTGNPKGAKISHRNLINLVSSFTNEFKGIDHDDRCLSSTNISFDVCIWEFFMPLLNGASLYIYEENTITDIFKYCSSITNNNITLLYIAPNILENVYSILSQSENVSIQKLLIGVEPITTATIKKYFDLNPNMTIINGYGPTETTVCATSCTIDDDIINNYNIIPIGKPLKNLSLYILSKDLSLVPVGVPGELYVSGDNVGQGYLNNKDLTDKAFISLQKYNCNYAYKTGDIVKWNSDGTISFIGRKDSQVKINGHRIELGEIENCIYQFANIEKVIVLINSAKKIIAYFSSRRHVNINNLKKFLQKKLPAYFIPNFFVKVDSFKLTANGKIDTKSLKEIEIDLNNTYEAPITTFQKNVVEIIENILSQNHIGLNNNFFEIGGDSLTAINLCTEVYSKFNVQISIQEIFENSVIGDLCDLIASKSQNDKKMKLYKAPSLAEYPVSYAQQRIYYANIVAGDASTLYNTPGGLLLSDMPDVNKLEKSFKALINRHETLRTSFELNGQTLIQKINDKVNFKINVAKDEIFEDDINNTFINFVKPFDLSSVPLIRASLYKVKDSDSIKAVLFVDLHHIICDGTSLNILINELCKIYNDETLNKLTVSYKDFVWTEKKDSTSAEYIEAENYWLSQFSEELPVLEMPTSYVRPATKSFSGKSIHTTLDTSTVAKINSICADLNITPYMFMLASYYILLYNYTMQEDIIIGSPAAARCYPETNDLVGMFVNTLALRAKIDSNDTFRRFLNQIKELCLNSYKYQVYPFDEIVNKLKLKRNPSRTPLFDTLFTFQNTGVSQKISLGNIESTLYTFNANISKFDLSMEIVPNDSNYIINLEYCDKLFNEDFITKLESHYINILTNLLDNLDTKISNVNMLSNSEKDNLLLDFNNTHINYQKDKTISQLFEQQVAKTPNNIALVFEDSALTYNELNEKANSLANYLRKSGVGRNDFVGIMVNRSLEMIIAILAVLKAGGTYIPIDPEYPQDRIEYMLNNSHAKMLLTFSKYQYKINYENIAFIELSNSNIYLLNSKNLENINKPSDSSYVIYTSGSTGLPKGVVLTHKALSNLTNYCNNYIEYLKNGEYSTIVSVTTVSFDIFIFETLISLQRGLKLVIANDDEKTMPILLNKLIEKNNITIIQTTPSRMQFWVDNYKEIPSLANLKYITLAGEPLPITLSKQLKEISGATIYNGYGPSETTVFSTLTDVTNYETITIGKPLYNTDIYILNANLQPVPIGIPGELYIAGDGLGKGYLNNQELTDKSFIDNPFVSNTLMYKTGDLGYWLPNGEIMCLGRNDSQVKIRGLRIELGEIESCICSYPNIEQSVVVVNSSQQILAYYKSTDTINKNDLKTYLQRKLPAYFIPSGFEQLEKFPMTPNGKVNKKVLRNKEIVIENTYEKPTTEIEKKLVKIFENVLHLEKIGINDNFFELGGDSLSAIKLQVEAFNLGLNLPYKDIFSYPTVKRLSENISKAEKIVFEDNYDYIQINNLLKKNKYSSSYIIRRNNVKNILLTGSTGFVGSHIIDNLLKHTKCNIYCLIRRKNNTDPQKRLADILHFYFGDKYDKYIFQRIFAVEGDITRPKLGLNTLYYNELGNSIDCIINAAALVKHYGNSDLFKETNISGVNNLVKFSLDFNCRLIHLSTLSVSGNIFETETYTPINSNEKITFSEQNLYIKQDISNIYVYTKFMAERIILENIISKNLNAKIIRLGNITNRYSDGAFQINVSENAFLNRINSFLKLGCIPNYLLNNYIEFTPVDVCADAIVKIVKHESPYSIFHLYNNNFITIKELLKILKSLNININAVDKKDFDKIIKKASEDELSKNNIAGIVNDFNEERKLQYATSINEKNTMTNSFLRNILFKWPKINKKYIQKYITYLKSIGYLK